jgi:predicted porin
LGGEFDWNSVVKIRSGYKLNYEQESWSVGFGYTMGKIVLDLAYSAMKDFSGVTSYSVQYNIK